MPLLRKEQIFAKAFVYQSHGKYTTGPADHILQPVASESIPPEGHNGLVLLPADPQVIRSAPGTMVDGDLRLFRFAAVYQISNLSCRT